MDKLFFQNRQPHQYRYIAETIAWHMEIKLGLSPTTTPDEGAFDRLLRIIIHQIDPSSEEDLKAIRDPAVRNIKMAKKTDPWLFEELKKAPNK